MKRTPILSALALFLAGSVTSRADLLYTFNSDVEGCQNVIWQAADPVGWTGLPGTIMQSHTGGGWQNFMTKEFSWGPGGGSDNQQLEMRALANLGANARISFDIMVDGKSFPAGQSTWYQLGVVGNSDGATGWTQLGNIFSVSGWHNADDATLLTMHIDQPFSWLGWEPGDSWFQFWTIANSDGAVPVNAYFDNLKLYAVPEPSTLALLAVGTGALLIRRRH